MNRETGNVVAKILTVASVAFVLAGVGCLAVAARLGQLAERRWS